MKISTLAMVLSTVLLSSQSYSANTDLDKTVIKSQNETETDIEIIDAVEIDNRSISNITDIVKTIPGVQVNDTGDRYGDSGFNIRGLGGDAVSITVDGIDQGEFMISPTYAPYAMYGNNRNITELETVKAIEVVKGPNSINVGSGAMAGSVAFITKDPEDILGDDGESFAGQLKTGYKSRNEETLLNVAVAGRIGGLESMLILTQRDQSETEAHGDGANVIGAQRGQADPFDRKSVSVLGKLIYNISDGQKVGLVFETSSRDTEGDILSRQSSSYYDFGSDDTTERDRFGVFYNVDNANNILFNELDVSLDSQELYSRGATFFSYASSSLSNDILREEDRSYRQESITLAIDLVKTIEQGSMSHNINYGVDWKQSEVENVLFDNRWETTSRSSTQTQHLRDPSWVPKTERTSTSFYLQDTLTINDQWSFNAGVRYENTEYSPTVDNTFENPTGESVSDSEYSSTVGSASVRYEFVPNHSIIVSYGQGYKSPTTAQLYIGSSSGAEVEDLLTGQFFNDLSTVANSDLEAEESTNTEISYLWEGLSARVKLTYFDTDYDNRIENVSFSRSYGQDIEYEVCGRSGCSTETTGVDTFTMAENVGKVSVNGVELEAQIAVNDNIYLSFAYSAIDGEHETDGPSHEAGDDLLSSAPDNAVVGLFYESSDRKWGVSGSLSWTDGKDESDQVVYASAARGGVAMFPDSYTVLDLAAYYNISDNLKVTAAINNVTDKKYWRWEVVNSQAVINGTSSGFQPSVDVENGGMDRFSEPGRNGSITVAYSF